MTRTLLPSRKALRVSGPEAGAFLARILTQELEGVGDEKAAFAALLTPQGKIVADFIVAAEPGGGEDEGESFLLDCHGDSVEALVKRLSMYRLRARATIELLEGWDVGAVFEEEPPAATQGVVRIADPRCAALGHRLIGPADAVGALLGDTGADEDAYDRHRLSLGVPAFGRDFGAEEMFLLDVNYDALHGVDYKKGCFIGQEVSSRMKRKGQIRKRTLPMRFEGAAPEKGTAVTAGDAALGEILSGAGETALALIRLDRLDKAREAGAEIMADGRAATIAFPDWLDRG